MDSSILSGTKKPSKKIKVRVLKVRGASKLARQRGRATNHNQIDGRKWRRDHPKKPHEHDMPKEMKS